MGRKKGVCSMGEALRAKTTGTETRRKKSRADRIRTCDLLNPIQAHYQAVLQPVDLHLRGALLFRTGGGMWQGD